TLFRSKLLCGQSHCIVFERIVRERKLPPDNVWSEMEMDRRIAKVFRKIRLHHQPSDFSFWQDQPYPVRIRTLEEIRSEYHGRKHDAQSRLQRVYTIVKR